MKKHQSLLGQRFGRLVVISNPIKVERGNTKYECKCDCGNTKTIYSFSLTSNKTTSCGCYHNEQLMKKITIHGMSNERFYSIWEGIVRRATSNLQKIKQPTYESCTIDENWLIFINFKNDMYESYLDFVKKFNILPEIDKDIKGGHLYSKDYCIWVSSKTNRAESTLRNNGYSYTYNFDTDVLTKNKLDPQRLVERRTLQAIGNGNGKVPSYEGI